MKKNFFIKSAQQVIKSTATPATRLETANFLKMDNGDGKCCGIVAWSVIAPREQSLALS